MPAFTARMTMYMPGGGSLGIGGDDEVADIDRINQGLQKIDAAIGAPEYAQANIPVDPFPGQVIKVTETGDIQRWNDTQGRWELIKPNVGATAPANPYEGMLWVDTN